MQVSVLSVQRLFDRHVHYQVPLYQRPYVWNEKDQWRPLWEDLRPLADALASGVEGRAHFMGATVQDNMRVPAGTMETRRIIDGQQRLTTLQILLKAFCDVVKAEGVESYATSIQRLLLNDDPLIIEPHKKLKVWPTKSDQCDYQLVMDAVSPQDLLQQLGKPAGRYPLKNRNIPNAYLFFYAEIHGWLVEDKTSQQQRIKGLYGAIKDQLRLVVIDLDEKDDAQAIFETLNARGAPLLSADLIKNSLLNELPATDSEDAYRRYWQDFDQDGAFWRELVGRGHAQRARIETFLQHALTLMTGDIVSVGHLYNAYRDYGENPQAESPQGQLMRLHRLGGIYKSLHQPQQDERLSRFYYRLSVLDVVTAWPFILALYEKYAGQTDIIRAVLMNVESYLVRRMVCRLSSRGYGKVFASLTSALIHAGDDAVSLTRDILMSGRAEVDRWPGDGEFKTSWTTLPLYLNLTRPRVRFLLEAMEEAMRTGFAETGAAPKNLTIEHIMPQAWREHWPLAGDNAEEMRDMIVHRIGNLTLLNGKLNPHQSNHPWTNGESPDRAKRKKLEAYTVLCLNREICKKEAWTEVEIAERGLALFAHARQIWPRPDSKGAY